MWETTRVVQGSFTQFPAWKKMSKRLFLGSSEFRHSDYIMQQNNDYYTCFGDEFLDRFLRWAKHQKEATKWNWVTLTTLCKENTRKMCARYSYPETMKLDLIMKKEYKKLELELWGKSLEFQNVPKRWIQIQITIRRPTSCLGVRDILTSKKNWDECWCCEEHLQKVGWDCLQIQKELKRAPAHLWKGRSHWRKMWAVPKRIELEFRRPLWSWGGVDVWGWSQFFDSLLWTIPDRMILKTRGREWSTVSESSSDDQTGTWPAN